MKRIDIKNVMLFVVLLLVWMSHAELHSPEREKLLYMCAYFFSLSVPYLIKNKLAVFIIVAAVTGMMGFYNISYFAIALPPLLLILAHKYGIEEDIKDKGRKNETGVSNIYTVFSLIASVFQIAYTIAVAKEFPVATIDNMVLNSILWMPVAAFALVIFAYKNKKNVPVQLRSIYLAALVGVIITVICYFPTEGLYLLARARKKLVYWFVFFISLCINDDPTVKIITESIKKITNNDFLNRKNKVSSKKQNKQM